MEAFGDSGIFWIPEVSMPIAYRPAQATDLAALAAIRAIEWETQAYWEARIGSYFAAERQPAPPCATFVAEEGGIVIGLVSGHRTRRLGCSGELQWINVIRERRREGIASALVATIAEWFARQGALRICVNAEAENIAARALYTKYGARALNAHWMIWEDIRPVASSETTP
jgi:GNAT superfamily N-acetyltransferase